MGLPNENGAFPKKNARDSCRDWATTRWKLQVRNWLKNSAILESHWEECVLPVVRVILLGCKLQKRRISHLDVGCGSGSNTEKLHELLRVLTGASVKTLGIEIQQELVGYARYCNKRDEISFYLADATSREEITSLTERSWGHKADLVTCFYVLHDEPHIRGVLRSIRAAMEIDAFLIVGLIHPERAELLRLTGKLVLNPTTGPLPCGIRWIGYYPIQNDGHTEIALPYFHRSLSDYLQIFGEEGFSVVDCRDLPKEEQGEVRQSGFLITAVKKA